jgi:TetR/AcrR family transcriptional repressor of mexJK operon
LPPKPLPLDDPKDVLDGRRRRGLKRRDAVLAAARTLFVRHGYRDTTLDAIIALSGGSRETIYATLGGKRGLIRAIICEVGDQLSATLREGQFLEQPPRQALAQYAQRLVQVWHSDEGRAVNRIVMSEGLDDPELFYAWYQGGPQPSIQLLSQYLDAQSKAGNLSVGDSMLAARQFVMLLIGETAFPFISATAVQPGSVPVDRAVDFFLRAHSVK